MTRRTQHASFLHGLWHGNEFLPNGSLEANGHVGKCFAASRNDAVGVAREDFFGGRANGRVGRNARLRNGVGADLQGQPRVNTGFAGNVGGADFLNDIAANDVIDSVLGQGSFCQQALNGETLQVDGQLVLVNGGRHGKWETHARNNHHVLFGGGAASFGRKGGPCRQAKRA